MLALGIDPGTDGGAALLTVEETPKLFTLPLSFKYEANWEKKLFEWCVFYKPAVFLENVHSMPGQGVSTTFQFGYMTGAAGAVLKLAGINPYKFEPQLWQNMLRLPRFREIAERSKRRAKQRKAQEALAKELHPGVLGSWQVSGKKGQGDVFGGVLIAHAGVKVLLAPPKEQSDLFYTA